MIETLNRANGVGSVVARCPLIRVLRGSRTWIE
jgi:hypothetical protein